MTMVDHDRPWSPRYLVVDHGSSWSTVKYRGHHGRVTMVDRGQTCVTFVDHGRPRSTMIATMIAVDHDHGRPWSSHMTMFFSCVIASMNYVW